jgi:uncharacterized membrane protein YphA (DoxX/SURF4 family)
MSTLTRLFLVLLRLAIGWHFLFEGVEKIYSVHVGPTTTNRPFTSADYLRQSSGPLRELFRKQAGDLDKMALERLTLLPLDPSKDPKAVPLHERLSPALSADWDAALDRYVQHYGLDDNQQVQARTALDQAKEQAGLWLQEGTTVVERKFPNGTPYQLKMTTPDRIKEYRKLLVQIEEIEDQELPAFGQDVKKKQYRDLKADTARIRDKLLTDLNKPLTEATDKMNALLTPEQKAKGAPPPAPTPALLKWTDYAVMYGLTAIGACLLLGLFTRSACLFGALFLASLYAVIPAIPWVPENIRTEGHYYYVNKNAIEMFALLALATTRSGCWLGLDGLLYSLSPRRWRAAEPGRAAAPTPNQPDRV